MSGSQIEPETFWEVEMQKGVWRTASAFCAVLFAKLGLPVRLGDGKPEES